MRNRLWTAQWQCGCFIWRWCKLFFYSFEQRGKTIGNYTYRQWDLCFLGFSLQIVSIMLDTVRSIGSKWSLWIPLIQVCNGFATWKQETALKLLQSLSKWRVTPSGFTSPFPMYNFQFVAILGTILYSCSYQVLYIYCIFKFAIYSFHCILFFHLKHCV